MDPQFIAGAAAGVLSAGMPFRAKVKGTCVIVGISGTKHQCTLHHTNAISFDCGASVASNLVAAAHAEQTDVPELDADRYKEYGELAKSG